jgi:hypothetical protein
MSRQLPSLAGKILRFVLMTIGLGLSGIAFGVIGALIGGKVLGGDSAGFAALGLAISGAIAGFAAGIIIGIISLKTIFHQRGSLWRGILGSLAGAVIILVLAGPFHLINNTDLLLAVFCLGVPLGGMAGFFLKK